MMKKKFKLQPVLLLGAAAILLLASTVGSTQAALIYRLDNFYTAEVSVDNIGVTLLEDNASTDKPEIVDYRNYTENGTWSTKDDDALELLGGLPDKIVPETPYEEKLSVMNSGAIDSYVRVVITKSWQKPDGTKDTELSPAYIELNVPEGNGWVKDSKASTPEREIYYYTQVLSSVKEGNANVTEPLTDTFKIDHKVASELIQRTSGNTVTYEYKYNGYKFVVEAEVDAVQTHNAADAIKSAWGIDVTVAENGSLSSSNWVVKEVQ